MTGAAAGSRAADVLHKTVASGLILVSVVGLVDVMRGFGVLAKRNIDRKKVAEAQAQAQTQVDDSSSA
jgi:hypothetical protein